MATSTYEASYKKYFGDRFDNITKNSSDEEVRNLYDKWAADYDKVWIISLSYNHDKNSWDNLLTFTHISISVTSSGTSTNQKNKICAPLNNSHNNSLRNRTNRIFYENISRSIGQSFPTGPLPWIFFCQGRRMGRQGNKMTALEFLSFRMTQHLHSDQVICHVGLKSASFWGILLSEQFFY